MSDGRHPEALAVVREGLALYNRAEFDRSLELLPPGIEWDTTHAVPDGRLYRGREDLRALWLEIAARWDEFRIETERWITGDDVIWMVGRMVARGTGSGVPIEGVWDQVWRLEGGELLRCENYTDREAARAAAGLSEADG